MTIAFDFLIIYVKLQVNNILKFIYMKYYQKTNKSNGSPLNRTMLFHGNNQDQFESEISSYINNFLYKTKQSISLHEILFKNNLPQRCLKHNNILTLYCQKDRFPICVSCLYHGTEHKNHKVVPLKNANKLLLTDTQNLQNKLQRKIEQIEDILKISTQNLMKIQRIYPEILSKIEINFNTLYSLLKQQQNHQVEELYFITERLRKKHLIIINEYDKLLNFFLEKNITNGSQDEETTVFKRNILSKMTQSSKILQINVKQIQFTNYSHIFNTQAFKEIEATLLDKLSIREFPQIISFSDVIKQNKFQETNKSRSVSPLLKTRQIKQQQFIKNQESISRYPLQISINVNSISRYADNHRFQQKSSKIKTPRSSKTPKRSIKFTQGDFI